MQVGRPVLGRTLVALAGAATHLNGLHCRGFSPCMAYQEAAAATFSAAANVGYTRGEVDHHESQAIPYIVPPGVAEVHVALLCLSYEVRGSTPHPSIAIELVDGSGVQVDAGCVWSRDDGTLPGHETNVGNDYYLTPYLVESSTHDATDPTSQTGPRRISTDPDGDGGHDGEVLVFLLTGVYVRVIGLYVIPVPVVTL